MPLRSPAQVYGQVTASEHELDFSEVQEILKSEHPARVDEFLKLLEQKFPRYLSFHTFAYESHSIQTSNYQFPRAIVFGPSARFVFSFNSTGFNHSDAIETLAWDETERHFSLREIRFRDSSADKSDFGSQPYLVSEVNPAKCMMCHGDRRFSDARPIWDQYFFWRGIYSGIDDNLTSTSEAGTRRGPIPKMQSKQFNSFMNGNRHRGRYAFLPPLETSQTFGGTNAALTERLSRLNFDRIAKRFTLPQIEKIRYSLLLPLSCEFALPARLPNFKARPNAITLSQALESMKLDLGLRQFVLSSQPNYLSKLISERRQLITDLERTEGERISTMYPEIGTMDDVVAHQDSLSIGTVTAVAKYYGVTTEDWAMRPTLGGRGFRYDERYYNHFARSIINSIFSMEEQISLLPLFPADAEGPSDNVCDKIKSMIK